MNQDQGQATPVTASEYEPPTAVRAGTLTELAKGTYSDGQSDDGDFSTVKWQQG